MTSPESLTPNPDVWVIVRCFNEAPVVGDVIRELRTAFHNVVGVDDGSTDARRGDGRGRARGWCGTRSTSAPAPRCRPDCSTRCSTDGAQYFVCFDADGQHRVDDAAAMVARMRAGGPRHPDRLALPRHAPTTCRAGGGCCCERARVFERLSSGVRLDRRPQRAARVLPGVRGAGRPVDAATWPTRANCSA